MSEPRPTREGDPYISASQKLPELTVKAIVLAVVLAVVLGAANAYLGLFAGMTVSASIPAAVVSMGMLRLFRKRNILENNIVQTAASAGESLAAGVIFTLPALVLLGAWERFEYWQTTLIAMCGGLIGVVFTIPLRRALIVDSPLKFPEGVATAEVLMVGERGGRGLRVMAVAAGIGGLFKLLVTGFGLLADVAEGAVRIGRGAVGYFGCGLSPALVAVGYIVGLNIAVLVFLGGVINWCVAIPIVSQVSPAPAGLPAGDYAWQIWSTQTRYLGVGAMLVGGLWAVVRMAPALIHGVTSGIGTLANARRGGDVSRTERDTPMRWAGLALVVSTVPLFLIAWHVTGRIGISVLVAGVMLVAGFLFSAIAAYMAGLVGSSNNPISGVTIATILLSALLLLALGTGSAAGPAAAILIGATVCCAAAIGGDNMQDLKAGRIVGATPWKQQAMQAIGVVSAAVVVAPVLQLLHSAYTIGSKDLSAPQATLMASVADGVFLRNLPWAMIAAGAAVALLIILVDLVLERYRSSFRMPVLAVAVGIYLPLVLSVPILVGGLVSWWATQYARRRGRGVGQGGLLFAAGLITGEALLGIGLAVPAAMKIDTKLVDTPAVLPGLVLLAVVVAMLLWSAVRPGDGGQAKP